MKLGLNKIEAPRNIFSVSAGRCGWFNSSLLTFLLFILRITTFDLNQTWNIFSVSAGRRGWGNNREEIRRFPAITCKHYLHCYKTYLSSFKNSGWVKKWCVFPEKFDMVHPGQQSVLFCNQQHVFALCNI